MFKNIMEGVKIISHIEFREVIVDNRKLPVASFLGEVEDPDSARGTKKYIFRLSAWGEDVMRVAKLEPGAILNCTAGLISKVSWQDWKGVWHTSQYPEGNIRTMEIVDDGSKKDAQEEPQNTEDPENEEDDISVEDAKKILEAAKKGKKELEKVKKELGL